MLTSLPALQMMSISADQYHQRTIPFHHVVNAIAGVKECGVLYSVAVCTDNLESEEYKKT